MLVLQHWIFSQLPLELELYIWVPVLTPRLLAIINSTINNADINSTGAVAYNFYASGDAPNYFKGLTEHVGGVKLPALLSAPVLATDADGNIIASDALTESEGDGLYLSKVNDDTAAGKITFNERPTF